MKSCRPCPVRATCKPKSFLNENVLFITTSANVFNHHQHCLQHLFRVKPYRIEWTIFTKPNVACWGQDHTRVYFDTKRGAKWSNYIKITFITIFFSLLEVTYCLLFVFTPYRFWGGWFVVQVWDMLVIKMAFWGALCFGGLNGERGCWGCVWFCGRLSFAFRVTILTLFFFPHNREVVFSVSLFADKGLINCFRLECVVNNYVLSKARSMMCLMFWKLKYIFVCCLPSCHAGVS